MSNLTGNGIVKRYGDKEVLHGVNLELERNKIYGLIGRNGAGKTTLLSILTAQNPVSEGTVTLDGKPVWENREALAQLCFSRELNPSIGNGISAVKVKEYLRIASVFFPNWDQELADKLIRMFRLETKKPFNKLSKGMLSMVTIVVAMASKAEFTFMDEPVAGLDVVARDQFYRLVLEEYENTGRTFVISTHIIEEASDIFEEVIIMDDGAVLLKENTQDLLDRSYHISGRAEAVDAVCEGRKVHHEEHIGRSKGVTVLLNPGEELKTGYDVAVQKPNLQKLFVALCGDGEEAL